MAGRGILTFAVLPFLPTFAVGVGVNLPGGTYKYLGDRGSVEVVKNTAGNLSGFKSFTIRVGKRYIRLKWELKKDFSGVLVVTDKGLFKRINGNGCFIDKTEVGSFISVYPLEKNGRFAFPATVNLDG
jgi:hypothetical protein